MPEQERTEVSGLDALVFGLELVMLVVLAVAGARLGPDGLGSVLLAMLLPIVAMVVWGRWLAPRAPRRLDDDARLVGKLAVFVIAAALLVVAGLPLWGALFAVVGLGALCGAERRARRRV